MVASAPSYEAIGAGLRNANEPLEPDGQRYALTLLRTLAQASPSRPRC